jgi:thiaminase/transcriptional activator TenA
MTTATTTPNGKELILYTDELRIAAGEQWGRIIHHKFTKELAAGTIDRTVLSKYLIQDYRFLNSFVILLASIIAKVRTLQDRIPGCQFLAIITGKENTYFERCFNKLGITDEQRQAIPDAPCTKSFCTLMEEVAATGNLYEMLPVIIVCEWSYLSWGQIVLNNTNREDFVTYEWVDLHSGSFFESVITYLRSLLDNEVQYMDNTMKQKCQERFLQTVQLEEDFFNYAYSTTD